MLRLKRILCTIPLIFVLFLSGCMAYTPDLKMEADNSIVFTRTVNAKEDLSDLLAFYGGDTTKVVNNGDTFTYTDTITTDINNIKTLESFYGFKTVEATIIDDKQVKLQGTLWDKVDYANMAQGKKTKLRIIDDANVFKNKNMKCKYIFGTDMDIIFFVYKELGNGCTTIAEYGNQLYNGLSDKLDNAVICTLVLNSGVNIDFVGEATKITQEGRKKLYDDLTKYLGNGTIDCDGALNAIMDNMYVNLREQVDVSTVDYTNMPKLTISNAVTVNGVEGTELSLFGETPDTPFEVVIDKTKVADVVPNETTTVVTDVNNTTDNVSEPSVTEGPVVTEPTQPGENSGSLDLKTILVFIIVGLIVVVVIVVVIKRLTGNKTVDVAQNDIAQRNVNKAVRNVNSMHSGKDTKVPNTPFKTPDAKQEARNMQQNIARANQGLDMTAPAQGMQSPFGQQQQGGQRPVNQQGMQSPFVQQQEGQRPVNQQGMQTPFGQQQGGQRPVNQQGMQTPFGQQQGQQQVNPQGMQSPFMQQQQGGQRPTNQQGVPSPFNQAKPQNVFNQQRPQTMFNPANGQAPSNGNNGAGTSQPSFSSMPTQASFQQQVTKSKPTNNPPQGQGQQGGVSLEMLSSLGGVQDDDDDW